LCAQRLETDSRDVDALALMSRLCLVAGDVAAAIACASVATRMNPTHPQASIALDAAMAQRADPDLAAQRFLQALRVEPEIAAHAVCYGSAPPFEGIEQVRNLLEEALGLDPALAPAHAALANVLSRQELVLQAIAEYRRALDIDPQQTAAALALSELHFNLGQVPQSRAYRDFALWEQQLYLAGPRSEHAPFTVLVLNAPAPWAENTPLEFMIDPQRIALHRLYLTDRIVHEAIPPYDAIFCAIGQAEHLQAPVERAQAFIASQNKRVVNRPDTLWKTARPNLADALAGVHGCAVPRTRRTSREELEHNTTFPLLARPIDTHAGRGLERLDDTSALRRYLDSHGDDRFDVTPFVEYRSADRYYRKYRVLLVGGKPYPYHLAISPEWMVHYINTPTASVDWMSAEEERFLADPRSVFADWDRTFGEIALAIGLDYFGVDCTLMPDGNVLVFEADAALLVHCREPAGSYKHRYVPQIFRAVEALLTKS
jgi:tetratricopeptide (TPR) repeat protein